MAIGIIAGTGAAVADHRMRWREVPTPYGAAFLSDTIMAGRHIVVLRRHGPMLNVPPHLINYRANLWALRESGAGHIIATAAVGSLRRDLPPGSMSVIDDFIDFTRHRMTTFFDSPGTSVVHLDYSVPYCPVVSNALEEAAGAAGESLRERVKYLCVDGPRYETPAEIRMFAGWGADVVGMTGVPEVVLARELGMCYGALAIITNYAAGVHNQPLSHDEVVACVSKHRQSVETILERAVAMIPEDHACSPSRFVPRTTGDGSSA